MHAVVLLAFGFSLFGQNTPERAPAPAPAIAAGEAKVKPEEAKPTDFAERVRAAMQASLEKQKASVKTQAEKAQVVTAPPPAQDFYTVAWPSPLPMPSTLFTDCDPLPASQLDTLITENAQKHGVQAALIRAVIRKESAGKPCAQSPKGAQGLMQLMPSTAAELNVADPFEPKQNVDAGTRFLKSLIDKYGGDLKLALGAYNAGSGTVDKQKGVPDIAETQDYVKEIIEALKQ